MIGSVIYRRLWLYRGVMTLLYKGRYRARFARVAALLRDEDQTVLELCFGDVAIAEYCRSHGKSWIGLDVSDGGGHLDVSRGEPARGPQASA